LSKVSEQLFGEFDGVTATAGTSFDDATKKFSADMAAVVAGPSTVAAAEVVAVDEELAMSENTKGCDTIHICSCKRQARRSEPAQHARVSDIAKHEHALS
jgi:hypothetical protein